MQNVAIKEQAEIYLFITYQQIYCQHWCKVRNILIAKTKFLKYKTILEHAHLKYAGVLKIHTTVSIVTESIINILIFHYMWLI